MAGTLPPEAIRFMTEPRGAESLFDLQTDPLELLDLSGDPAHAKRLSAFRDVLREHATETGDLGLIPESLLAESEGEPPSRRSTSTSERS